MKLVLDLQYWSRYPQLCGTGVPGQSPLPYSPHLIYQTNTMMFHGSHEEEKLEELWMGNTVTLLARRPHSSSKYKSRESLICSLVHFMSISQHPTRIYRLNSQQRGGKGSYHKSHNMCYVPLT